MDLYTSKLENIPVIGDLTISINDNKMKHFCESYNLKSLIKVPTYYENLDNPSCIDLRLTNKTNNFQSLCVIETSLSDFYEITVTVIRTQFRKLNPRTLFYRDCTKFSNTTFINSLKVKLGTQSISPGEKDFRIFAKIK